VRARRRRPHRSPAESGSAPGAVVKVAMTVLLIAPLGFVMGMPFPTALEKPVEWHDRVGALGLVVELGVELAGIGSAVCSIWPHRPCWYGHIRRPSPIRRPERRGWCWRRERAGRSFP